MNEIIVKRKINCGKTACGKCDYVDYSGRNYGDFWCGIFNKETLQTKAERPKRLPECIEAEHK